ncbi:DUF2334 domain-containing protein [Deinococcus sp.]|uniref:DUF2334 domain-containing protein n=1 Tax=Deinococcus sp. TaxID=47478 RepID=UPI003C7DFFFA
MQKLAPALLTLSLVLAACGNQTAGTGIDSAQIGSAQTTTDTQSGSTLMAVSQSGDAQSMFGKNVTPPPYRNMVPIDPALLQPPLPDTPENIGLRPQATAPVKTVRVYYSDPLPTTSPYRDGGSFHAVLLKNLLGQYDNVQVISRPISQYVAGDAASALRTFYIGTVFDEKIPASFLADVAAGAPVSWIGYNVWELGNTLGTLGLSYKGLHTALSAGEIAAAYSTVNYKGYNYHKYPGQQEMVELAADPARTETLATATNVGGGSLPYLVRSGKFYYVADNPFQYITPTDRYLVLADSLHKMLGDTQAASTCKKQAILRLEDIASINDPQAMSDTLDVIAALKIPFAMTLIPESWYGGVKYPWTSNGAQLLQVYRALNMGGLAIQHGYTHNYQYLKRSGSVQGAGNSGDEWEFWDKENNVALPGLNTVTARTRMQTGRNVLLGLGISPRLWTTPHYEADTSLYTAMTDIYPKVIERRIYSADGVRAGQFFPYPVRDAYGTQVVPENLGNVQVGYGVSDILEAAEANKNLDCAYASLFVHPYLLEAGATGPDHLTKDTLKAMIVGIQQKGYTFVNPLDVTTRSLQ